MYFVTLYVNGLIIAVLYVFNFLTPKGKAMLSTILMASLSLSPVTTDVNEATSLESNSPLSIEVVGKTQGKTRIGRDKGKIRIGRDKGKVRIGRDRGKVRI